MRAVLGQNPVEVLIDEDTIQVLMKDSQNAFNFVADQVEELVMGVNQNKKAPV